MKKMKKLLTGILLLSLVLTTGACGNGEKKEGRVTVGIAQFAEHPSLDNCREGFLKGLAQEGFEEGKNLKILYENAGRDGSVAAQIADNMVANKVDLFCAITTPMAQTAYSTAKDSGIPILFTAITDPVAAELANENGEPVGNITGTSDKLPIARQLEMIKAVMPEVKKVGILYCTGEVNSEVAIKEYKERAKDYGLEIVEQAVSGPADIPLAVDGLLPKVDCVNNITDNTVVDSLDLILMKAEKAGLAVFGSEVEQVKKGCLASVGIDYVALGVTTGKMAAKVLKGEKKASEMKFLTIEDATFYGNKAVAERLHIKFPEEYEKSGEWVE